MKIHFILVLFSLAMSSAFVQLEPWSLGYEGQLCQKAQLQLQQQINPCTVSLQQECNQQLAQLAKQSQCQAISTVVHAILQQKQQQGLDLDIQLTKPTSSKNQRIIIIANRLPVSPTRDGDKWSLDNSGGGLVSLLLGVKQADTKWIGSAGLDVPDEVRQRDLTSLLAEKGCVPVFLDNETWDKYYNGCMMWPLLHYLGLPQEADRLASYDSQLDAYKRANQMFADIVGQHYQEGDVIWIHDYHLMLLPKLLKDLYVNIKIGWFLHEPFPTWHIFRTLPFGAELLHSVLYSDLIGFHTNDYATHFLSACTKILGLKETSEGVVDQEKQTRVAAFPIGIDFGRFSKALELPEVKRHIDEFTHHFSGRKVVLGIERLDTIKGIPQKILAFEKFLQENPELKDKVVLLQIAVPSRTDIPEYKKLRNQVHEMVGRVNGRFGTFTSLPIHLLDRSVDFNTMCALYAVSDVALITSLRDGLNLVSYEYITCQQSKKGVLVLSEFAGAAESLGAGAILVNPWNTTETAKSIYHALTMEVEEREKRHMCNYARVTNRTAEDWAESFLRELNDTVAKGHKRTSFYRSP